MARGCRGPCCFCRYGRIAAQMVGEGESTAQYPVESELIGMSYEQNAAGTEVFAEVQEGMRDREIRCEAGTRTRVTVPHFYISKVSRRFWKVEAHVTSSCAVSSSETERGSTKAQLHIAIGQGSIPGERGFSLLMSRLLVSPSQARRISGKTQILDRESLTFPSFRFFCNQDRLTHTHALSPSDSRPKVRARRVAECRSLCARARCVFRRRSVSFALSWLLRSCTLELCLCLSAKKRSVRD